MNKILSVLAIGLVAGSLSAGAMAKPADVSASKAPNASVVKKDAGHKASLKKDIPSAKKEAK